MRLFLGVFPPPAVLSELGRLVAQMQRLPGFAAGRGGPRWVQADRRHLTLCFLGEQEPAMAARILEAGRGPVAQHPRFDLDLAEVGGFPDRGRARVLWVGVGRGRERIEALARTLVGVVEDLGIAVEERSFHPHLTLARAGRGPLPVPEMTDLAFSPYPVSEVALVESRIAGPERGYRVLGVMELG